ncbi:hypothetical protein BH09BAC5_BH09BAC5_17060 [soil metagenome]
MKQKSILLIAAAFFAVTVQLSAQYVPVGTDGLLHCGTDQQLQKVFAEHPEIKADFDNNNTTAEAQDAIDFQNGYANVQRSGNPSAQTGGPPQYIIPLVFHIVHDYGPEDISDAQVLDAVRILNIDYRKNNADTTSIVSQFVGIASDAKIEFRLANLDPNGNCTNGIDRVASIETYIGDDGSKLNYWPRNKYLNVWVTKVIGAAGAAAYAYLPGTAPSAAVDGVIALYSYVGSIGTSSVGTSRTLTHEIGHFLNLQHTWGSSNNPGVACGNDGVTDTPVTKGWQTCNLTSNMICTANVVENVQNYMEYSYCSRMFTAGQVSRMHSALGSPIGQRNQLTTAGNLTATGVNNSPPNVCAPKADFLPNEKVFCCVGSSVTFTDMSYNGHPTSWNWSFPGGTPSTSTDSIPVIAYNTAGNYAASLTVANASGSNSVTKTALIAVSSSTATYTNFQYAEGMENATTFATDYTILNPAPAGNTWARTTTAAATGSACVMINNTSSMLGTTDEFVSPSIDMTQIPSAVFTFKVAQRQRTSTSNDRLRVYTSTNCGQTWIQRYSRAGTTLSTGSATTSSSWTPAGNEWRTETVTIGAVQNNNNVRFKFTFESDGGNSCYVDDINIISLTGISVPDAGIQHFEVYPNPIQDNTLVSFSLDKSQHVSLQLFDMTGRLVLDMFNGELGTGEHEFPVQTAEKLNSGLYFVRLTNAEGRIVTQKLIVQ